MTQLVDRGVEICSLHLTSEPSRNMFCVGESGLVEQITGTALSLVRKVVVVGNWRLVNVPLAFSIVCLIPRKRADVNTAASHSSDEN